MRELERGREISNREMENESMKLKRERININR